jgi:hypothetical protein
MVNAMTAIERRLEVFKNKCTLLETMVEAVLRFE